MTIFAKKPIITLRLGSKYASVIINLILTSATQLYSKITKINKIFIVTPHFYLKLRKKSVNFLEVLFDCTQKQIDVKRYQEVKKNFFHLQLIAKRSAGDDVAQLWSRDPEIIKFFILEVLLNLTWCRTNAPNYQENDGFLDKSFRL